MDLCQTCKKMLYRTDPCKGVGIECGRTDGGSKKSTGAPTAAATVSTAARTATDRRAAPERAPAAVHPASRKAVAKKDGQRRQKAVVEPPVDTVSAVVAEKPEEAMRPPASSGANYTRIEGATFVAEVPARTELLTYGNRVLAAGPDLAVSIVTSKGLIPLLTPLADIKKGGRPRTVEDRASYKAEKERERRARERRARERAAREEKPK